MLPLVPIAVCCGLAVLSAIGVVLFRRPVHAAIGLLAHSLSLAALYMALSADFAAVGQMLIYSGAIVVLFLIVVALLPAGGKEQSRGVGRVAGAAVVFVAMLGTLLALCAWRGLLPEVTTPGPTVQDVGRALFGHLLVAFELTAPLLLASIVGAIVLWRRQLGASPNPLRATQPLGGTAPEVRP